MCWSLDFFRSIYTSYLFLILLLKKVFFSQNKILSMYICPEMYFYKFICVISNKYITFISALFECPSCEVKKIQICTNTCRMLKVQLSYNAAHISFRRQRGRYIFYHVPSTCSLCLIRHILTTAICSIYRTCFNKRILRSFLK